MSVQLLKNSIDLGIIVKDAETSLKFYRDTLGLDHVGDMPMPGGGTMHRLMCGESMIKVIQLETAPPAEAPPGGIQGATGYRYWTMTVSNMGEILEDCAKGGYKVIMSETEIAPGIKIAIVADPDGNWVEFLSM